MISPLKAGMAHLQFLKKWPSKGNKCWSFTNAPYRHRNNYPCSHFRKKLSLMSLKYNVKKILFFHIFEYKWMVSDDHRSQGSCQRRLPLTHQKSFKIVSNEEHHSYQLFLITANLNVSQIKWLDISLINIYSFEERA